MTDPLRAFFDRWSSNPRDLEWIHGGGRSSFPGVDTYIVPSEFLRYIERLCVELNTLSMDADRKRDIANLLNTLLEEIKRNN